MMPRVFIPQLVERYDASQDRRVPVFDFSSAATFGTLTPILDESDDPLYIARVTRKIQDALVDFGAGDYFVAVGDPSVIAICAATILRTQDTMKMLKWDKKLSKYLELEICL